MPDLIPLMQSWLDVIARGAVDEWPAIVSPDIVMRLPYSPAGINPELRGIDQACETIGGAWKMWKKFTWLDVVIRRTEDPELLVTTCRSEAPTVTGRHYANSYVIFTRFKNGLVVEHTEYFNPLAVMALFEK